MKAVREVVDKLADAIGSGVPDPTTAPARSAPVPQISVENKPPPGQRGPVGMAGRTTYSKVNHGSPPTPDAGATAQKNQAPRGMEFLPKMAAAVSSENYYMTTSTTGRPALQDLIKTAMEGAAAKVDVSLEVARQISNHGHTPPREKTAAAISQYSVPTSLVHKLAAAARYSATQLNPKLADANFPTHTGTGPGEGPNSLGVMASTAEGDGTLEAGQSGMATAGNRPPMNPQQQKDPTRSADPGTGLETNDDMQHDEQPEQPVHNEQNAPLTNDGVKAAEARYVNNLITLGLFKTAATDRGLQLVPANEVVKEAFTEIPRVYGGSGTGAMQGALGGGALGGGLGALGGAALGHATGTGVGTGAALGAVGGGALGAGVGGMYGARSGAKRAANQDNLLRSSVSNVGSTAAGLGGATAGGIAGAGAGLMGGAALGHMSGIGMGAGAMLGAAGGGLAGAGVGGMMGNRAVNQAMMPKTGSKKTASLKKIAALMAKTAANPEYTDEERRRINRATIGGAVGSRLSFPGAALGAGIFGGPRAALGAGAGNLTGSVGGAAIDRALGTERHSPFLHIGNYAGGALGGRLGAGSQVRANRKAAAKNKAVAEEAAAEEAAADPKVASLARNYMALGLRKQAEDALNPAKIHGGKASATGAEPPHGASPSEEGTPSEPSDVQAQKRRMLSSNQAAIDYTKREAKGDPKSDVDDLLREPSQTRATDSTLHQVLDHTDQAGAKISSADMNRLAASRAILQKIAAAHYQKTANAENNYDAAKNVLVGGVAGTAAGGAAGHLLGGKKGRFVGAGLGAVGGGGMGYLRSRARQEARLKKEDSSHQKTADAQGNYDTAKQMLMGSAVTGAGAGVAGRVIGGKKGKLIGAGLGAVGGGGMGYLRGRARQEARLKEEESSPRKKKKESMGDMLPTTPQGAAGAASVGGGM